MFWFLLWLVLVLGAALVLGLLCRRLYRQAKALTAQMSAAAARLDQVNAALAELSERSDGGWDRPSADRTAGPGRS